MELCILGDTVLSIALKLEDGQDYSASIQILGAAESSLRMNDLNSYRLARGKKSLESLDLRTIKPDLQTFYSISKCTELVICDYFVIHCG